MKTFSFTLFNWEILDTVFDTFCIYLIQYLRLHPEGIFRSIAMPTRRWFQTLCANRSSRFLYFRKKFWRWQDTEVFTLVLCLHIDTFAESIFHGGIGKAATWRRFCWYKASWENTQKACFLKPATFLSQFRISRASFNSSHLIKS